MSIVAQKKRKVTIPVAIGYGLIDIMGGGAFTIIGAYLLFFYTTFVGLTPIEAASIVAIARIVDAIVSLFMGSFTDHFYKYKLGQQFGRRRFFLLIGSPLMLLYILLWITGMNYWFYLTVYLAFEIVAAVVLIPWETLPSEMTKDYNDRTKLSTGRMFLSASGTFLATLVPGILIKYFGEHNAYAYFINGLFFAIIFAVCVFISYKATWERELTPEMLKYQKEKIDQKTFSEKMIMLKKLFKEYLSTFNIKAFRRHLAIYLFSFTAKDIFNTVFVFFCVYCLSVSSSFASGLLSLSIIGLPITLLAGVAMVKYGPSKLYLFSYSTMIICILGFFILYLLNPTEKTWWLYIFAICYQAGRCVLEFTPWNVFPFIPDVDEILTKQRREGLYAAVMTFGRKTTVAIATFCVGIILQKGGFEQGTTEQSAQAIHTISILFVGGTIGLLIIALIFALTFKLNKQTHAILVNEIDRLKNNGSKNNVTEETRKVVENLTGHKYADVWNNS
ncbi:MFS transporter [Gilliamella sp. Fer2-1]|nr:MFS transporter [Gilliamella apicola]OCG33588.1 MFS transporter [Gilliamella apicola]OCG56751.1 MFS transporter [Gilliamella apicola]OCG74173.1 MFS transporter [Gilliamella apicola]